MNHALAVNKNVYFIGGHIKEPRRFDKLQSLVHHCSRIDGNFCAHAPVRMLERLLNGYIFQVITCSAEERTAGSGQNKAFDALLSGASLKRLEYCGMFAVDRENRSKVIVLGSDVARTLLGSADGAVGRTVKLDGDEFTVVGVLQNQGQSMGLNTGNVALVPFSTAVSMGESGTITSFYAKARGEDAIEAAKGEIGSYLTGTAHIPPGRFDIISQDEMLRAGNEIDGTMTLLLAGIAGISLVVAGIGVMNVMLVSVTERTREIGIKKALGARRFDILVQFLLEALVLSIIGGVLGIAAGIALGLLMGTVGLAFVVSWGVVAVAVAAATAIGLVFGIFPAYRASRKNPIEALRTE